MPRYIDADNAIKDIRELAEKHHSNGEYQFANGVLKAITRITSQPTADVKEVVRGKWVHPKNESDPLWHLCSNCGKGQNQKFDVAKRYQNEWAGEIWFSPFCPNCGADMRELEEND